MKSELLKIRYSRLTWALGVTLLLLLALAHIVVICIPYLIPWMISMNRVIPNFTTAQRMSQAQLDLLSFAHDTAQWQVADIVGSGTGLVGLVTAGVALFGALSITAEYRHDSISLTVQLEPRRSRVLAEKLAALGIATTILTVGLILLSAIGLWAGTTLAKAHLGMSPAQLALSWVQSWVVLLTMALFGFGIGLIVRSQLVGVAVILGLAMLESIIRPLSMLVFGGPTVLSALPFGLSYDVTGHTNILTGQHVTGFSPGPALLMLIGWAVVIVLAAGVVFRERDVAGRA